MGYSLEKKAELYSALTQNMERMFFSGRYSDLVVKCGAMQWRVHKAVLCPQCPFFEKACDGTFKEAEEGVITLKDDEPFAVQCMLHFLYFATYSDDYHWIDTEPDYGDESISEDVAELGEGESVAEQLPPILLNVHVHVLADKYDIPRLGRMAAKKFEERASNNPFSDDFAKAAVMVYTAAVDRDRELRTIVVSVANYITHNLGKTAIGEAFRKVASTIPALGSDLWQDLAELNEMKAVEYNHSRCPKGCGWFLPLTSIAEGSEGKLVCMKCSTASEKGEWTATKVDDEGLTSEEARLEIVKFA
ncbi:hypothetical protein LTR56_011904 [Elasticomyces elasticus]|nr:hypothetical protein LTR56_011904 [Elasticomyces elasticus]KAK3654827.1 hypothetical protein LTR22_010595 [Elasticomyces elasticus]KAK4920639.1 hypothetical protein LTR49_011888 [Elasticomyces elasticus]KAK5759335.1 hypothetical protein LTS12_010498 [Elasticomyces elasticus]